MIEPFNTPKKITTLEPESHFELVQGGLRSEISAQDMATAVSGLSTVETVGALPMPVNHRDILPPSKILGEEANGKVLYFYGSGTSSVQLFPGDTPILTPYYVRLMCSHEMRMYIGVHSSLNVVGEIEYPNGSIVDIYGPGDGRLTIYRVGTFVPLAPPS